MNSLKKMTIKLTASLKAVIAQFHNLPNHDRVNNIVKRVTSLTEKEAEQSLNQVMMEFEKRHRNFKELLMDNFHRTQKIHGDLSHYSSTKKLLLGSFLTKEYSIQSAALFNPSIVSHPDQTGLKNGEQRFIMSLRAVGEGHISSIIFETGVVDEHGVIILDKTSGYFTPLKKDADSIDTKDLVQKRLASQPGLVPEEVLDTNYNLSSSADEPISEKVIFPSAKCESMGMEDLRLVQFGDENGSCYYGTYTAYNGKQIMPQLLETTDFIHFRIRSFYGAAVNDKGMALFPEKIGGKFMMISRQGSEVISIMTSDDLYHWEDYQLLLESQFDWEFVQIGNCGSPIKTEKGWLLLTHGVGSMRKYVISAILLDLHDPSKIIGRLDKPMISAEGEEREGYVPNVVYTCGLLRHGKYLIIPYAVSDTSTVFATVELDEVLSEMKPYELGLKG